MDKLLAQEEIGIQHFTFSKAKPIVGITFNTANPSSITFSDGEEISSSCILCKGMPCMLGKEQEVVLGELSSSQKTTLCPTDAISMSDDNTININNDVCIKCGLCLYNCPIGSIFVDKETNFHVNNDKNALIPSVEPLVFDDNIVWSNQPLIESDGLIEEVISRVQLHPQKGSVLNLLTAKLLQEQGIATYLTRQGDVNLRMDGLGKCNNTYLVIEIESNADLDAPRDILDDVAVFCSRYNFQKDSVCGLIVLADLPNKRTEYWELISDIENVVSLEIYNIPLTALLTLFWAGKRLDYKEYKLNRENYSSRNALELSLGREVNISNPSSFIEAAK